MNVFDCLSDILKTKSGNLTEKFGFQKAWSTFVITRYMSMDDNLMDIACKMNRLQGNKEFDSKMAYKLLNKAVPKRNSTFIRYITKPKKTI